MLVESHFAEVDLMDLLFGPKRFSVPYVDGDERVRRYLEKLLLFAGQPLGLIFHLPTFLIFLLASIHIIGLFRPLHFLKGSAGEHQVIFSHSNKQTSLSKVILHYEYLVSFHQNNRVVSSDLPKGLQYFFL